MSGTGTHTGTHTGGTGTHHGGGGHHGGHRRTTIGVPYYGYGYGPAYGYRPWYGYRDYGYRRPIYDYARSQPSDTLRKLLPKKKRGIVAMLDNINWPTVAMAVIASLLVIRRA